MYCGSSAGNRSLYTDVAADLGKWLACNDIDLVYGGASRGLMGSIADAVLAGGGRAIGVIPKSLAALEISHNGLTELRVVDSMHERKRLMAEMADAFVALPGGYGTLEEILEILTWSQLRFHDKPCVLLNAAGYFDSLLNFLDHACAEGFIRQAHRDMLLIANCVDELSGVLDAYVAPDVDKLVTTRKGSGLPQPA